MRSPSVHWRRPALRRSTGTAAHALDEIGVLPPMLDALLTATDPRARESTWGVFVDRYTPLLLRTVYRFVRSYDDVMDRYTYLLEELRRNEFRRLRAFAAVGPGRFTTWLVVVTSRLLLDFHRQRYGRARLPTTKRRDAAKTAATMRKRLAEMVGEELRAGTVEDWSTDPEDGTCAVECAEAIQAAVSSLAPRDQLLLKLRFHQDLAAREIAAVMEFPTHFHVYRRLRAVLEALRQTVPRAYGEYVGAISHSHWPEGTVRVPPNYVDKTMPVGPGGGWNATRPTAEHASVR